MGLKPAPTLAWAAFAAGLATQHVVAGVTAAAAFAAIHAVTNRRRP
ncbi:hypothetical protein [Actinomadura sp. KC06]|nr:hypothetical protein [Actinomadura sp. KC06]